MHLSNICITVAVAFAAGANSHFYHRNVRALNARTDSNELHTRDPEAYGDLQKLYARYRALGLDDYVDLSARDAYEDEDLFDEILNRRGKGNYFLDCQMGS